MRHLTVPVSRTKLSLKNLVFLRFGVFVCFAFCVFEQMRQGCNEMTFQRGRC